MFFLLCTWFFGCDSNMFFQLLFLCLNLFFLTWFCDNMFFNLCTWFYGFDNNRFFHLFFLSLKLFVLIGFCDNMCCHLCIAGFFSCDNNMFFHIFFRRVNCIFSSVSATTCSVTSESE